MTSAHVDTFARDHLPPPEQRPEFLFDLPELQFPAQLNCATELLDRAVARGPRRPAVHPARRAAALDLRRAARRRPTASPTCWCEDMGLVPGNRVLLRAPNNPMLAACWFAVIKAGGIAVAHACRCCAPRSSTQIIDKAQISARAVRRCAWPTS